MTVRDDLVVVASPSTLGDYRIGNLVECVCHTYTSLHQAVLNCQDVGLIVWLTELKLVIGFDPSALLILITCTTCIDGALTDPLVNTWREFIIWTRTIAIASGPSWSLFNRKRINLFDKMLVPLLSFVAKVQFQTMFDEQSVPLNHKQANRNVS